MGGRLPLASKGHAKKSVAFFVFLNPAAEFVLTL